MTTTVVDGVLVTRCFFCRKPIDPFDRTMFRGSHAWERQGRFAGRPGGGSDLTLRQPLDEYAHPQCIDEEKNGIPHGQGSLI